MTFRVQARQCSTCIYHRDSPLDLQKLEDAVRDPHVGFRDYRICHHSGHKTGGVCCRGFWNRHKDEFSLGQIAQRLGLVEFVKVEELETEAKKRSKAR